MIDDQFKRKKNEKSDNSDNDGNLLILSKL